MAIPDVSLNIRDGALGIAPASSTQAHLKLGVSVLGAVNTVYSASDPNTMRTLLGNAGPMVEAGALSMATQVTASGPVQGGPIYFVVANPSTYGTVSAVTKVGLGAETLAVIARPAVGVVFRCSTPGALGTAVWGVSFDGGVTYPYSFTSAATVVVPGCTLLTVAISAGAAVVGDTVSISTSGVVTPTGTGVQVFTVSAASPVDAYTGTITFVSGGANGTATFTHSLDNGNTVSPVLLVPASGLYVIPDTGLVLGFTGAITAGDYFTFTTSSASFSTTDLANAMTAILADPRQWAFIHVVGAPATSAASATLLASLDTQLGLAANAFRFARGMVECFADTDSGSLTAFAASASTRVMACAQTANLTSAINGRILPRNTAWLASARASKVPPSEDLGRVNSGACTGVVKLNRDEQATPGLDAGRFTTLRTIIGRQGYYITNGRLMAPAGSDFVYLQNGRVMDIAAATVRQALLIYLNDSVRVDPTSGFILEADARQIESYVDGQLRAALTQQGYASDLSFQVSRTQNILSTNTLATTTRVTPLGYAKAITVDIGFVNPALIIK